MLESGRTGCVGWTKGLSFSESVKPACGARQRNVGGGKPSDDNGCADDGDGPVVFMWRQRYSNGYSDISRYSLDLASQVTPLVVTSHPSLSSLSPTSRGCLLPHESDLDHHAAYSVSRLWSLLSLFFVLVSIVFVFYDLPFFILACS